MQNDIGSLLHKVSKLLDKTSDQVLQERLGIGLSQFRILLYLLGSNGAEQRQIAESLSQTEPSISRQVKVLNEKGLAVVRRSAANRRSRLIFLTQKGANTAEKAVNILNEYHAPMFEMLSQRQQEQLVSILQTIQEYIKD
jgi:DNA-binding MarR family transcriptional regulator